MADIDAIINGAQTRASETVASADAVLMGAISALGDPPTLTISDFPLSGINSSGMGGLAAPDFDGQPYQEPPFNVLEPVMQDVPLITFGTSPVLNATKEVFISPVKPTEMAAFTGVMPTVEDVVIPPPPAGLDAFNVTPPTINDVVLPPAPTAVIPDFTAVAPTVNLAQPGDFAETYRQDYAAINPVMREAVRQSAEDYLRFINPEFFNAMAQLEAKYNEFLQGGTALPPAVEQAIYDRARDKTNEEYIKNVDVIYSEGAKRGFTIPSGAMMSSVLQARQGVSDNNTRVAFEIAIKQAELEQQNMQWAMTQSQNLRQLAVGAVMQWAGHCVTLNGHSLEYARDILQAMVAVYDTMVKIVSAQIEVYKAEASVYGARVQAALAIYEVYKAELEGIKTQVEVDGARVQAYTAQVQAYGALANAYKAILDGVATKAEIQKLKVDMFGTEVQAYSALVGAKTAEWQGYSAQINGEVAKIGAYKAQVDAYSAEVDAYKAQIQAQASGIDGITSANNGKAQVYSAAIQAYRARVEAASAEAQAYVSQFNAKIAAYVAEVNAAAENARVQAQTSATEAQVGVAAYQAQIQAVVAGAQMSSAHSRGVAEIMVSAGNAYAGMAQSAMAGVGTLASENKFYEPTA
jgi:hypothetical protein